MLLYFFLLPIRGDYIKSIHLSFKKTQSSLLLLWHRLSQENKRGMNYIKGVIEVIADEPVCFIHRWMVHVRTIWVAQLSLCAHPSNPPALSNCFASDFRCDYLKMLNQSTWDDTWSPLQFLTPLLLASACRAAEWLKGELLRESSLILLIHSVGSME